MSASRGRWPLRLALAGLIVALLAVTLAWLRLVPGLVGLGGVSLGALLGTLAALGAVVSLIRGGRRRAIAALVIGLGLFAAVIGPALPAFGLPRINDVTTDLESPPQFHLVARLPVHRGTDLSYPADFVGPAREAYGHLEPAILPDTAVASATASAADALGSLPGCEVLAVLEGRVEGTCETAVLGFVDDVVVRIRREGSAARVDIRSRSRVGRGDLGANAARIERLLRALQ